MSEILVLGGGYAGMMAAIRAARLTRKTGGKVTLVNASPTFTERLRLHQTAAGQPLAPRSLAESLAGTGVRLEIGRVTALDPARGQVRLADPDGGERVLGYDKLVYALGAVTDTSIPGVDDHAYTYDDHESAVRLSRRLDDLTRGTVVVAGGGLTGVESAAELAETRPHLRVVLVTRGRPGSMMGESARAYLDAGLERLGVEVRSGAAVTKVLPDGVELEGGELIHSDATLWTTGIKGLSIATESGLTVDAQGRIVVDSALRSVSHPDVYAVGDAAAITQKFGVMHGTCQGGIPAGLHAAGSLAATLQGKEPAAFRFGYVHQPTSLGRRDAVIQFTHQDDTPRRWYLTGRAAIRYKEVLCASSFPTFKLLKRGLVPVWMFRLTGI